MDLHFLAGFSYGLFLSCFPWFVMGMLDPKLAVPTDPPRRRDVVVRYWLVVPFLAFMLWLTAAVTGTFSASLPGWLAGLFALAVAVPAERRLRRWRKDRAEAEVRAAAEARANAARALREKELREAGVVELDPDRPPVGADDVVLSLCAAKGQLLKARRVDLAGQADRLYARYAHAVDVLRATFDPRELTFDRSRGLVAEVVRGAVDDLGAMAALARGVSGVDAAWVRRRLAVPDLPAGERAALQDRLALVDDTESRLRALGARTEGALTELDRAAVAVARIQTAPAQASVVAEQALQDLRRFADKAELYGRSPSLKE